MVVKGNYYNNYNYRYRQKRKERRKRGREEREGRRDTWEVKFRHLNCHAQQKTKKESKRRIGPFINHDLFLVLDSLSLPFSLSLSSYSVCVFGFLKGNQRKESSLWPFFILIGKSLSYKHKYMSKIMLYINFFIEKIVMMGEEEKESFGRE